MKLTITQPPNNDLKVSVSKTDLTVNPSAKVNVEVVPKEPIKVGIKNAGLVNSVNGQIGAVVLDYADVGAPSTTGINATGTWNIDISGNAATADSATLAGNVTGIVAIANGGTGANNATNARTNLVAAKSGSNSDITSLSGITGGIDTPDYLQLDTAAATAIALGKLRWNSTTATAAFGIIDGTVECNIGEQMYAYVTNADSVTIQKGQPVYLYAATGNRASVKLAGNLGDSTSAKTLGLATQSISPNQTGFVTTQGVLDKIDTSAFAEGDTLYLGATAGTLTNVKPKAPNHLVYIGVVERANNGNGQIYVKPQNGYELDELHDVQINSPSNGQTILYDASTSLWKNANLSAGTGISVTNGAASATITNTAPDQTVVMNSGTGISVTGTYPNFTVTNTSPSSGGTVTSVSGTAPISVATGTTTPAISITQATTSTNGYLSSTDWNTFNNKQPAGSYLTTVTASTPLSGSGTAGSPLVIAQATTTTSGYLSSTDWNTFNNKGSGTVTSVGGTGTVSGISLSGTVTSSGNLTLGGALDLSAPPTIGNTTPNTGAFTTLTAQTEVLKGTGQNLLTYSEQFDNAAWTKTDTTISVNSTTAPNGATTADTLLETATTTEHQLQTFFSIVSGIAYTVSIYVKANGRTFCRFGFTGTGFSSATRSYFDLSTGTVAVNNGGSPTITSAGNGWYRLTVTNTATSTTTGSVILQTALDSSTVVFLGNTSYGLYIWGSQLELGSTANTYIPTTTTAVYGTPSLSFSGVAGIGLESNGSLYHQPAGTGAVQAQATTSTATGGNARGANAVDWQTSRSAASQVASGQLSFIGGGTNNSVTAAIAGVCSGGFNTAAGQYAVVAGGAANNASSYSAAVVGGQSNNANGYFNFIGGGFTNTGTSVSSVTTQAAATNGVTSGSTAVTLSGSNASIKVGQLVRGTGIVDFTYVAAISGTSLTLSQAANATGTPTLSFYTPHGVVVGGGNNQATGSYSFIGGGGDAGTAGNRNVASGDWSVVCGGTKNTAVGNYTAIVGGNNNTVSSAANAYGFIGGGISNTVSGFAASILGGQSNTANSTYGVVLGAGYGNTRSITGYTVLPANNGATGAYNSGGVQSAILVVGKQTTDATATVLTSDNAAASTTNQVILPNNSAYLFKCTVIAGVTGAGNTSAWKLEGAIKRGATAGSTAIVGTVTTTLLAQDVGAATWAVTATADTTNGGLKITFTGQAGTTIRVVCKVETTEMTY